MTRCDGAQARRLRRQHTIIDQLRPRPVLLLVSSAIRGEHPSWVKGGCGRQADGTAALPPAPEIPVHSGAYASCQQATSAARTSQLVVGAGRSFSDMPKHARRIPDISYDETCAYRKSNPDIFVMQSAEDRAAKNTPCPLYGAR
jgi:hypothetical protein